VLSKNGGTLQAKDVASKSSGETKSLQEIALALFKRINDAQSSLPSVSEAEWTADFIAKCAAERRVLELAWETTWKEQCNGKVLFANFQSTGRLKISPSTFKRRIMQQMKLSTSENWRLVASLLRDLVGIR
jgi:hypothetical protein